MSTVSKDVSPLTDPPTTILTKLHRQLEEAIPNHREAAIQLLQEAIAIAIRLEGTELQLKGLCGGAEPDNADEACWAGERDRLQAVMLALRQSIANKLEGKDGTAICGVCGDTISSDRLTAKPGTTTCLWCQRGLDGGRDESSTRLHQAISNLCQAAGATLIIRRNKQARYYEVREGSSPLFSSYNLLKVAEAVDNFVTERIVDLLATTEELRGSFFLLETDSEYIIAHGIARDEDLGNMLRFVTTMAQKARARAAKRQTARRET